MREDKRMGRQAGFFQGVFDEFLITGTRYIAGESGRSEWITKVNGSAGEYPLHTYLVVLEQFRKVNSQRLLLQPGPPTSINIGGVIEEPPDAERHAILKAIAEWSKGEPEDA